MQRVVLSFENFFYIFVVAQFLNIMSNTKNYLLFPERDVREVRPKAWEMSRHFKKKATIGNLQLFNPSAVSLLEMPTIEPFSGKLPRFLVPFHQARRSASHQAFIHFFIDDYSFECLWNNPERYLPLLKSFEGVIGTDFSQLGNMPFPQRVWNCYRNRLLGQWMQHNGINYIHNVTWSLPDSYDYSFDGLPIGSTIAINCAGIAGSPSSKYLWYKGYEEALSRLKPSAIVRYGTKMPGENEAISVYFQNERLTLLRNGR